MPNKTNNNRSDRGKNRKRGNVKKTEEERKANLAKQLGISDKTKAFYDELIENPKTGVREAYKKHIGDSTSEKQASVNASRLKNNDNYMIYKDSVISKAKKRVASLVSSENENTALKASIEILDRSLGKAMQRSENINTIMRVQLDISGSKIGTHAVGSKVPPKVIDVES